MRVLKSRSRRRGAIDTGIPGAALLALAREPEARRRMGEAARKDAEARFSLARQVETVAEAYRALLGEAA